MTLQVTIAASRLRIAANVLSMVALSMLLAIGGMWTDNSALFYAALFILAICWVQSFIVAGTVTIDSVEARMKIRGKTYRVPRQDLQAVVFTYGPKIGQDPMAPEGKPGGIRFDPDGGSLGMPLIWTRAKDISSFIRQVQMMGIPVNRTVVEDPKTR